jgi:hypothetical protein
VELVVGVVGVVPELEPEVSALDGVEVDGD